MKQEKNSIQLFLKSKVRLILIIIGFVFMIVAVRSYMTYLNITILIEDTKTTIEKNNEEIAYLRNFYKTYLDSDYGRMFFAHENNLLANGENIIKFSIQDYITGDVQEATQSTGTKLLKDPKEARIHFIEEKRGKIR